jgi:UDP-N-acetylmuramyl pentapeptide phosphotransferase/UDP-N-acetylglucosamine-1-phosphate transferase
MANPTSRTPIAGGFLLALSLIVGSVLGAGQGQASIGFVAGLGVGLALLLLVWLIDRLRLRQH